MSSKSKEHIPRSVVTATRAVLLSSVKGVPIRNFCRDYTRLLGEVFPWKKLGYRSPKEMLQSMSDIVRFEFSFKDGDYRLYGIGTNEMFMPSWVVKAQGNPVQASNQIISSRTKTPVKKTTKVKNQKTKSEHDLLYNANGLVTVFVSWTDPKNKTSFNSLQGKDIHEMKGLLTALVSRIAPPMEVYVHPGCHAFVRFSTIEEAEAVWKDVDGKLHNNLLFKVTPAKEKMPRGKVKPMVKEKRVGKRTSSNTSNSSLRGTSCSRTYEGSNSLTFESFNRQAVLRSRDSRVPLEDRSIHTAQSDTHRSPITKSCDDVVTLNSESPDQLAHRFRSLLDSFDLSGSGSDDSDGEWDFDLIDYPEVIPVHLNGGGQALVPTVTTTTKEVQSVGRDNSSKRVGDRSGNGCHSNTVPPSLSAIQIPNENGLIPIRVSEVISPTEIWIQMTEEPERDLETMSLMIFIAKPHTLKMTDVAAGICCTVAFGVPQTSRAGKNAESASKQLYRRVQVMTVIQHLDQLQAVILLVDTGATLSEVSVKQLYTLPPSLQLGVVPPLSIPTAIHGLVSTLNDGEEWFPLDKQLLWKYLRHKVVYARIVERPYVSSTDHPGRVGVMDLYFDPAGTNRVIDVLVKEGIFLGIRETNLDPRAVSPSISTPVPLLSLSGISVKENGENKLAPTSLSPNSDRSSLLSRLVLIQESLERKQLSIYEDKDQSFTTREKYRTNDLRFVDQTSSDLTSYCKEGPVMSSRKAEDDVSMEMPCLEDTFYSDDDEYLSDQSLSSLSDSRRLSYQSIVNSFNSDIQSGSLTHDRDHNLTDGSDSRSQLLIPDASYNGGEIPAENTTPDNQSHSRHHSRASNDSTSSSQDSTVLKYSQGNKTSPWGRMKLTNGLV